MTVIYLLEDGFSTSPVELAQQLAVLAGERYAIETVKDIAELQLRLLQTKKAIIVFSAPLEGMLNVINQSRGVLPSTAFIAVVDESSVANIPVLDMDCHFLTRPFDHFAILNQLSAAVRQCELLSTMTVASQVDEVTSLFNRKYLIQRLSEEISLSRRHLSPSCCVVVGVNFYQVYLDSYGYSFINALLRFLADKIAGMVRHEDILARVGDDEIGILLPRSTEKGAKIFTSRLVQSLNASTFKYGTYEEGISVCAGVAGYPLPNQAGSDADTIIRYARHALHQARNIADDEVGVQLFSEIKPVL